MRADRDHEPLRAGVDLRRHVAAFDRAHLDVVTIETHHEPNPFTYLDEARKILVAGNISYTDGDILRRLARAGLRISKLDDCEFSVEYLQEILREP